MSNYATGQQSCYAFDDVIDADMFAPLPFPEFVTQASAPVAAKSPKKKAAESKDGPPKPKRPLSAYNLFFQSERLRLLEQLPVRPTGKPRKSHGKLGFREMAVVIGSRWRALDDYSRSHFNERAKQDKERYKKEVAMYDQEVKAYKQGKQDKAPTPVTPTSVPSDVTTEHDGETLEPLPHYDQGIARLASRLDDSTQQLIINLFLH